MTEQAKGGRVRVWLVWNPQGRPPTYEHRSKSSAVAEAKRLAVLNPGQQFLVVKTTACFLAPRPPEPVAAEIPLVPYDGNLGDEIPF